MIIASLKVLGNLQRWSNQNFKLKHVALEREKIKQTIEVKDKQFQLRSNKSLKKNVIMILQKIQIPKPKFDKFTNENLMISVQLKLLNLKIKRLHHKYSKILT